MKAEQLRKSILQMAIQGKLVPQNPDDEPASVLLERIRAEKQKLIQEGKIKKDKNDSIIFKGDDNRYYEKIGKTITDITDELPFEIPDTWCWARIKNYSLSIFSGKSPKYSKEPTPHIVIGQQSNQWYGVDMKFCKYCTAEFAYSMAANYYLQNNDVLLNTLGNGTLGRSGIFYSSLSNTPVLTDGHLFVFRNITRELSLYLLICLRIKYDDIVRSANGSTNQTFLSLGNTVEWLIPIPPQNEINRIISEVEKFEPYILEYEKLEQQATTLDNEIYDKLKKSILQYAIQGKLVPQDDSDEPASVLLERIRAEKKAKLGKKYVESYIYKGDDNCYYENNGKISIKIEDLPFDIPDNWCWVRLGEIYQHNTGKALNSAKNEGKKLKYITTSNLYWDRFQLEFIKEMYFTDTEIEKCTVSKGDLLVCEGGDIGRSAIWSFDYNICIQNHIHRLRAYDNQINNRFYMYVLYVYKHCGLIGGKGIGIQGLSSNAIDRLLIPIPPINEQKRIVENLAKYLSKLKGEI